jgi:hypothetical protein
MSNSETELKNKLAEFCGDVRKLESEIGRVLVGQGEVVRGTFTP